MNYGPTQGNGVAVSFGEMGEQGGKGLLCDRKMRLFTTATCHATVYLRRRAKSSVV